jgi:RimJ/RimL family protein N-acetyltransferase
VLTDEEDRWQGLALVRHHPDHSGSAAINAMWIAPEARGRRGAGLLCDACAAWARAQELHELKLDVAEANEAAVRAYKAAGFAVCGKTTWSADGRTLHELVMTRPA